VQLLDVGMLATHVHALRKPTKRGGVVCDSPSELGRHVIHRGDLEASETCNDKEQSSAQKRAAG
jgi:hypothetical protein